MAKAFPSIINFTAGEFSPKLYGRVDVEAYERGLKTCHNFIPTQYGGAYNRPGTYFVKEVKDSTKQTRLIEFVYNEDAAYILEFGEYTIRFYEDGGRIEAPTSTAAWVTSTDYNIGDFVLVGGIYYRSKTNHTSGAGNPTPPGNTTDWEESSIYEIASPYDDADLNEIQYCQSGDIMYFTHPSYPVYKLSRYSDISWVMEAVEFDEPPFLSINTTATTLAPSGTTGSVTLTASTDLFVTGSNIGSYFKLNDGFCKVTAVTNATTATALVKDDFSGTGASADWYESAFSPGQGYARACSFYEQRLVLAGTDKQPVGVWGSINGSFEDFTPGSNASDGFYFIASIANNPIKWLADGRVLFMGNEGGVFSLSSGSESTALTPTNVMVKRESSYGCNYIKPVKVGNIIIHAQNNDRTIREVVYDLQVDSFISSDSTLYSDHINGIGVVDSAYSRFPDSVIWWVRSDGKLSSTTRQIDQKVNAWAKHTLGGSFGTGDAVVESVAVIPATDDITGVKYDQAWFVVKRTINDATVRYIEYMKYPEFDNLEDAFRVDCGLTYSGTSATIITGLSHLEGEEVAIMVEGAAHPNKTVSGGQVTLDYATNDNDKVHIGLPYESTLTTLRLEAGGTFGTSQGNRGNIYELFIRFYNTVGGTFGDGTNFEHVIPTRTPSMPMDAAPTLFNGDKKVHFYGGWDDERYVNIVQSLPLPMYIIGIFPKVEVNSQ